MWMGYNTGTNRDVGGFHLLRDDFDKFFVKNLFYTFLYKNASKWRLIASLFPHFCLCQARTNHDQTHERDIREQQGTCDMKLLARRRGICQRRPEKICSASKDESDRRTKIGAPGEARGGKSVEHIDFEFTLFLCVGHERTRPGWMAGAEQGRASGNENGAAEREGRPPCEADQKWRLPGRSSQSRLIKPGYLAAARR